MLSAALLAIPLLIADATPFETQSGLTLEQTGEDLRVSDVAKGSPAADAGFVSGDTLVHVDGKAVAGMDASKLSDAIKEKGGAVHHILVRNNGKPKLRTLKLKQPL